MSDEELARGIEGPLVGEEEEEFDPDEPREGSSMSPYAIASFATSMFGLWILPQSFFVSFEQAPLTFIIRAVLSLGVPIVAAAVAMWFATLGEDEIDASQGRLRGWSFCRAARIVGMATIAVAVGALIVAFAFGDDSSFRFG